MKKIIISDFDGTLYIDEKGIKENVDAIKEFRKNKNLFVIATGRSYIDLKSKIDLYSIPFDYLIVNHGGVILNKDKKVIDACLIPKSIVNKVLELVKTKDEINRIILFDAKRKDISKSSENFTKIMLKTKDKLFADELCKYLNNKFNKNIKSYVIVTKKCYLIEIISIKTDKGKAIEKILENESIDEKDVFTIGDGVNDVEMILKYNGYGITSSDDIIYKTTDKFCNTVSELIYNILK